MLEENNFNFISEGIENRSLNITVVGLGYVGLPSALSFFEAGFSVIGLDISNDVLNSISRDELPLLQEIGQKSPKGDRWKTSSDYYEVIPESDIVIVCVPTPIDEASNPDLRPVQESLNSIISAKKKNSDIVIILESTVQPGTTRNCIQEAISLHGSDEGGIYVAYCPERISPGENGFGIGDVSRVIGADYPELAIILSQLYGSITEGSVTPVSSIEVAEASKLVENAQRDIDIAFSNELAILLPKLNLDVEEVLSAASTKWNFHRHTPGIGVGGHCIPIDPHYYIDIAKRFGVKSSLSPSARELNLSMPQHNAKEIINFCGKTPENILILGYAYKPNVSDTRETPVEPLIKELLNSGVENVIIWDPHVSGEDFPNFSIPIDSLDELSMLDCIVIGTAHDEIIDLDWLSLLDLTKRQLLYDGRRCLDPTIMEEMGWKFHAIGRPLRGN